MRWGRSVSFQECKCIVLRLVVKRCWTNVAFPAPVPFYLPAQEVDPQPAMGSTEREFSYFPYLRSGDSFPEGPIVRGSWNGHSAQLKCPRAKLALQQPTLPN